MKRGQIVLIVFCVVVSPVLAADRLTDRDLKQLVAHIEEGRDRFDDALDGRVKRSIVRGPSGEVNVARFLDDFQENIHRLEERLMPEYAASAEAGTLLRQASIIDRFFRQQPAGTRGESEWHRLATDLKSLARAYGTDFPLPDGALVRRIGDRELAASVEAAARAAERLKDSLDDDLQDDASIDKSAREAIVRDADLLFKAAKTLVQRVKNGRPSSAEAERVIEQALKVREAVETHNVSASSRRDWAAITTRVEMLAGAYGTTLVTAAR